MNTAEPPHIYFAPPADQLIRDLKSLCPDVRAEPFDYQAAAAATANGNTWIFIDWLLPDQSGLALCRRLREDPATRSARITLVIPEGDRESRHRAMAAGADDYVPAPLQAAHVLERLGRGTGGSRPAQDGVRLPGGLLTVDPAGFRVRFAGRPIPLSPSEFRLLSHFVRQPDHVLSRTALIHQLRSGNEAIDDRTVDVWIGRLRRALRAHGVADPLRTVRGQGYVLDSAE